MFSKWINSSIWHLVGTWTGTTSLNQSGLGSNSNKGILHISQSTRGGASHSDSLESYLGHSLAWGIGLLPPAKMQSAFSTVLPDWAFNFIFCLHTHTHTHTHTQVFANGLGDLGSIPGHVIPKTLKMVLDSALLNTQKYEVRIKGKVEQSRERSSVLPYTAV